MNKTNKNTKKNGRNEQNQQKNNCTYCGSEGNASDLSSEVRPALHEVWQQQASCTAFANLRRCVSAP
eukprot:2133874-Amphidinium_carterae.1